MTLVGSVCNMAGRWCAMLLALLFGAPALHAEWLTPDEALGSLLTVPLSTRQKAPSRSALSLAYTATADGHNTLYVFNRNDAEGFVILSGNSLASPVLGISDSGTFVLDSIPTPLRAWLDDCQRHILRAAATAPASVAPRAAKAAAQQRTPIAPLVKSQWHQQAPFNNQCPVKYGEPCMVGCVAITMGQIMYRWQQPAKGTGSRGGIDLSRAIDWANILPEYQDGAYTTAQADAVADLLRRCGAAVGMDYDPNASAANYVEIPRRLRDNFGYDAGAQYLRRDHFSVDEWTDILYAELAAGRPVAYDARSYGFGGHSFILDGYEDGRFHFNWGWRGGYCNGYYAITYLDPDCEEWQNFDYEHSAAIGLQPDTGAAPQQRLVAQVAWTLPGGYNVAKGGGFDLYFGAYNCTLLSFSGSIGVRIDDLSDGTTQYASQSMNIGMFDGDRWTQYFSLSHWVEGHVYRLTPVYRTGSAGEWQVLHTIPDQQPLYLLAGGGTLPEIPEVKPDPIDPIDPIVPVDPDQPDAGPADFNADGKVTMADAVRLIDFIISHTRKK